MTEIRYMELNLMQILDVLRSGDLLRLALCAGNEPYIVPMRYQLEVTGAQICLHMASPAAGRKVRMLEENDRVCALTELPGCGWLDTVIIEGTLLSCPAQEGLHLCIIARALSGRRYFDPCE